MAGQKPKQQPNQPKQQPKKSRWSWLYYAIMIGLMAFFLFPMEKSADKDLSYTKFTAYISNDAVASVIVYDDNTAKHSSFIQTQKMRIILSY